MVALTALVLPFALSNRALGSLPTQTTPIIWLLTTLLVTVGPPFLLLSATAPLLQRWFSHTRHKSAGVLICAMPKLNIRRLLRIGLRLATQGEIPSASQHTREFICDPRIPLYKAI